MTKLRTAIRRRKGISGASILCKACGGTHEMVPLPVGIRSMLFALQNVKLLDEDDLALKDKEWKMHKRKHRLDSLGNPEAEPQR
ncbi:MAG: hypothetical protein ACI9NC_001736 [Verrucomicrobiales bacterium]|jgi:hypothetical protein